MAEGQRGPSLPHSGNSTSRPACGRVPRAQHQHHLLQPRHLLAEGVQLHLLRQDQLRGEGLGVRAPSL